MTSISNTDIESPEWKLKLENHLKTEDFFHVDSFPQAILEIRENETEFIPGKENTKVLNQVTANLTMRGISHEISFPYELFQSDSNFIAEGSVEIDRTKYNIQYHSGKFFDNLGDKLIYDDFTIQFRIYSHVIKSR
jgi:polyisoprenoid-binding protein YceI